MNIHFIRNEEGKREIKNVSQEDSREVTTKKIHVVLVGHIGRTQTEIIEILNSHSEKIDADIIIISNEIQQKKSIELLRENTHKEIFMELKIINEDMSVLFFEKERKPQHPNIYYTPKVQKAKMNTRRTLPRKK